MKASSVVVLPGWSGFVRVCGIAADKFSFFSKVSQLPQKKNQFEWHTRISVKNRFLRIGRF